MTVDRERVAEFARMIPRGRVIKITEFAAGLNVSVGDLARAVVSIPTPPSEEYPYHRIVSETGNVLEYDNWRALATLS